jgi:cytoskeletal protein CcmA (bactofilin family)
MWRRTEELKPSSPGASANEPAAPAANQNSYTTPATTISNAPVAAPPAAATYPPAPVSAPVVSSVVGTPSTIGPGLKIKGDITGDCHLVVEGEAQGKIRLSDGRVTVGANGRVNADIEAPEIQIEGSVQGNLRARDTVSLGPSSQVQGSVLARRIRIEDGARFRGKVEMTRPGGGSDASSAEPANASASHGEAASAELASTPGS